MDDVFLSPVAKYLVVLLKLKNSKISGGLWNHFLNFHSENDGKLSSKNEVLSPESADERKSRSEWRAILANERPNKSNNTALKGEDTN